MLSIRIATLLLLTYSMPVKAQVAEGDSVVYQDIRYKVFADVGAKVLPDDADFALRVQSEAIHVSIGRGLISWMREGFVHRNEVKATDEDCLLQATFEGVEQAPETTGLVIWRAADNLLPLINIPVDEVEKIPPNE